MKRKEKKSKKKSKIQKSYNGTVDKTEQQNKTKIKEEKRTKV
jgi:hypothetical protein